MPHRSVELFPAHPGTGLCSAATSRRHGRRAGPVLAAARHAFQPEVAGRASLADVVLAVAALADVARPDVVPEAFAAVVSAAALDADDSFEPTQAREVRRPPSMTRPDRIPLCASPGSSSLSLRLRPSRLLSPTYGFAVTFCCTSRSSSNSKSEYRS